MLEDDLEIPDFLKRSRNDPKPDWKPTATVFAMSLAPEKWERLEAIRKEQKKTKARGRVGKMLAVRADREAAASGKVWDVNKGKWV